jgi:catechol 2,3-dioxygenase-like lactoylglutathione lyase family enzyme
MMTSDPPFVECEQMHPGLAVSDIPASVDFYTKNLGFTVAFTWGDPPTFAGMNLGKVQTFLQPGTSDPKGVLRRRRCGPTLRISSRQRR